MKIIKTEPSNQLIKTEEKLNLALAAKTVHYYEEL